MAEYIILEESGDDGNLQSKDFLILPERGGKVVALIAVTRTILHPGNQYGSARIGIIQKPDDRYSAEMAIRMAEALIRAAEEAEKWDANREVKGERDGKGI